MNICISNKSCGDYNGKDYVSQSRAAGEFYMASYEVLNSALSNERAAYRISRKKGNLTNKVYWSS